ncbi:DUF1367 family protein [Burkholderia multivorans]|nr:DUF1367 family protein [Burkholderia multivorans]
MDIMLVKTPGGALAPVDAEAREMVGRLKLGQGVQASVTRARNVRFHRKGMALFRLAFDVWEPLTPLEYKGVPVAKDFERFRKDMTILAGFYKAVYNARGEVRLEAESLRFSAMSEERFEEVFKGVLHVVWSRVLKAVGYASPEAVEEVIEELLRFDQ